MATPNLYLVPMGTTPWSPLLVDAVLEPVATRTGRDHKGRPYKQPVNRYRTSIFTSFDGGR